MNKNLPIVEIVWRDSFGSGRWQSMAELMETLEGGPTSKTWFSVGKLEDEIIIHSIGYLISENKNYINLVASIANKGSVCDPNAILKKSIISMKFLRGERKKK